MICPYCENEMQRGYVDQTDARFGLRWKPDVEYSGLLDMIFSDDDIKLTSITKSGRLMMYHCEGCKKFIVDENEIEV